MENNNTKKHSAYISEEENTLNWDEIQITFKQIFGSEVYNSWLQKISLVKEYNDYLDEIFLEILEIFLAAVFLLIIPDLATCIRID